MHKVFNLSLKLKIQILETYLNGKNHVNRSFMSKINENSKKRKFSDFDFFQVLLKKITFI